MFALLIQVMALMLALAGFIAAAATEVNYVRNHRTFSGEKPRQVTQVKKDVAVIAAE